MSLENVGFKSLLDVLGWLAMVTFDFLSPDICNEHTLSFKVCIESLLCAGIITGTGDIAGN